MGCHFLLQCMKVKSESEVAQSCPTLSDPMDRSLRGFSIHGIFQEKVLEWGSIAFSIPAIYLGSNYGGGNEDNSDLPQKIPCMYCYSPFPQPCSRSPLTHAFTRDSWTPTSKSGTVSCGVTVPLFWVLVHKFLLCPPRFYFPVHCRFLQLYGGVNGDLL